jgi:hypothetical protein
MILYEKCGMNWNFIDLIHKIFISGWYYIHTVKRRKDE